MRRWLPYPLLWAALLAMWLLLHPGWGANDAILGALVACGASLALAALQAPVQRLRRPKVAVVLACLVLADIVRSNIAVGRIILHVRARQRTSGFVRVPLQLRAVPGLAVLACIVTATPGTAWARYEPGTGMLTLHVLDIIDEDTLVGIVKQRYERRLREIFE